jgi:hypothetical protein
MNPSEFSNPTDLFKRPTSEPSSGDEQESFQPASKRRATVYDAVAGKTSILISSERLLKF